MQYDRERLPEDEANRVTRTPRASASVGNEPSLGDLFGSLAADMSTLMRKEVSLAKTEMTDKATTAGKNIGALVVGGLVAYTGLLVLLATLVMGLDEYMATGLAALIVGGVLAIIGGIMVMQGINTLRDMNLKPEKTIESLKEDKEWLQEQTK